MPQDAEKKRVRPRAKWTALSLATLLTLGGGGGVLYASYESALALVHPARASVMGTPADAALTFENVTLATEDAVRLAAWWMPAANASATVIFLHGYRDSRAQVLPVAPALHAAGMNVLALDFRAHGESEGAHTTIGLAEQRDVRAAVAWAENRTGPETPIALFGWSMGAATAIQAATSLPQVRAVVADSAFATLEEVAGNSIQHFTDLPKYPFGPLSVVMAARIVGERVQDNAPVEAAARLQQPLLIVHGREDAIAPVDGAEAIARAAGPATGLWVVEGVGHVGARGAAPAEYDARVTAFLRSALK